MSKTIDVSFQITERQECDLIRFYETCEDGQGYDVPKDRMKSLARVGLIRSLGFSRYEITDIGDRVIEKLLSFLAAPVVERQDIQDWAIDHSAGRPILTLKGCSVIEAEDAAYVLSLVLRDQSPPAPVAVDERAEFDKYTVRTGRVVGYSGWREDFAIWQARACLDKVKDLNQ